MTAKRYTEQMMAYVNTTTACNQLDEHPNTLRNWDQDGWKIHDLIDELHKKTAHFLCRMFDGEEYSCEVIECNEAYTSKTYSYCGRIHKIGGKKRIKCSCGANVDRDLNGARGIYLRALAITPS